MRGMARAMGVTLTRGKNLLGKKKICDFQFFYLDFAPIGPLTAQRISTPPSSNALVGGRVVTAPPSVVTNCGIVIWHDSQAL